MQAFIESLPKPLPNLWPTRLKMFFSFDKMYKFEERKYGINGFSNIHGGAKIQYGAHKE